MKQPGSALLLILLVLSGIMVICSKRWLSASLLLDAVLKKEQYLQRYWLTQGLLECGVTMCKQSWEKINSSLKRKKKLVLCVSNWPPRTTMKHFLSLTLSPDYEGRLEISAVEHKIIVKALLMRQGTCMCAQRCVLQKQNNQKIFLSGWKQT